MEQNEKKQTDNSQNFDMNKQLAIKFMENRLISGIYQGETFEQWKKFLIQSFLELEFIYQIRFSALQEKIQQKDKFIIDQISKFNLQSEYQVRDFVVFFNELYIPHPDYKEFKLKQQDLIQEKRFWERYNEKTSIIEESIKRSYKEEDNEEQKKIRLEQLLVEKKEKLLQLENYVLKTQQELNKSQDYQDYLKIQELLILPYDLEENYITNRGKKFEQFCLKYGIPEIIKQLNLEKDEIEVKQNIKWFQEDINTEQKSTVGEIDLLIWNKQNNKIICLVECKSNLMDISHAYFQSGQIRSNTKQKVKINKNIYEVPFDLKLVILTQIENKQEKNQLKKESFLKEVVSREISEKLIKNYIPELKGYEEIKKKLQNLINPYEILTNQQQYNLLILIFNQFDNDNQ